MSEFWKALELVEPTEVLDIEYKLYYNKQTNEPICLSTETLDKDYIVITKEQYNTLRMDYILIVDGVVKERVLKRDVTLRLEPNVDGEFKTFKDNMMFVADDSVTETDTYTHKSNEEWI